MTKGKRHMPYNYGKKEAPALTWTHKIVCLAKKSCETVPSGCMKYELKCADLVKRS